MVKNANITLYHYDSDAEAWTKSVFLGVSWYSPVSFEQSGTTETRRERCIIRIFTDEHIEICNEDYIVRGVCDEAAPPKDTRRRVVAYSDNRRGTRSMYHWRIEAQ